MLQLCCSQLTTLLGSITTTIGGGPVQKIGGVPHDDELGFRIDLINNLDIKIQIRCQKNKSYRESLKSLLSDVLRNEVFKFIPNKLEQTSICTGRTMIQTKKLIESLNWVNELYPFKIFAFQCGQRHEYRDFVSQYKDIIVANPINMWDLTLNVKRKSCGVVMTQRIGFKAGVHHRLCVCVVQ